METVNVHQAKTQLSRLLARVELGEEIVIANRGVPVAKLVSVQPTSDRRASLGLDQGRFRVKFSSVLYPLTTSPLTSK